jgi:uncharacterized protein
MDRNERQVIDDLFGKIRQAEGRTGPRDAEAEALIRDHLARQPAAPYYMAQAIVVQQEALAHAQARLEELERTAGSAGGGFLGGLFGGGGREVQPQPTSARTSRIPATGAAAGQGGAFQRPGGGGFLAGAAQTALGVAGGVLIANAIGGMLAADEAAAAEPEPVAADEPGAGEDAGWGDDFADPGDMGDFGDF